MKFGAKRATQFVGSSKYIIGEFNDSSILNVFGISQLNVWASRNGA